MKFDPLMASWLRIDAKSGYPPLSKLWPFLTSSLGGLLFGYDTGIIAGAILYIQKDFQLSPAAKGVVVSSIVFGALIGAIAAGYLSDRFGRRRLLMLAAAGYTVGAIGEALAPSATALISYRFLLGIAVGISSVLVPLYLSEMAPTRIRGALTSLNQLMIAIGIFVSYIVAYAFSRDGNWRAMLGLAILPALVMFIGLWFQDESPRWLLARGRIAEAQAVLKRVYGVGSEYEHAIADIRTVSQDISILSFLKVMRIGWIRKGIIIAAVLSILQQLIGINTIVYYAPTILRAVGFDNSSAILNGACLSGVSIVSTLIAARIVDRIGRRPLMLGGALGMATSMLAMGLVYFSSGLPTIEGKIVSIACLAVFKVAFSISWGPLLWVLLPEILPLRLRGVVMGVAVCLNWVTNFVVSLVFPLLLTVGSGAVFELFAAFGLVAFVFTAKWLRETTGRSLEMIELEQRSEGKSAK